MLSFVFYNPKISADMELAKKAFRIFADATEAYHQTDNVDTPCPNPYGEGTFEHVLFAKNWVDVVQWHLEDLIRDPAIDPAEALVLKRRIDASNQVRTDMVEQIDTYFRDKYAGVAALPDATIQHRDSGMGPSTVCRFWPKNLSYECRDRTHRRRRGPCGSSCRGKARYTPWSRKKDPLRRPSICCLQTSKPDANT